MGQSKNRPVYSKWTPTKWRIWLLFQSWSKQEENYPTNQNRPVGLDCQTQDWGKVILMLRFLGKGRIAEV
jgi:hypothetical protein